MSGQCDNLSGERLHTTTTRYGAASRFPLTRLAIYEHCLRDAPLNLQVNLTPDLLQLTLFCLVSVQVFAAFLPQVLNLECELVVLTALHARLQPASLHFQPKTCKLRLVLEEER